MLASLASTCCVEGGCSAIRRNRYAPECLTLARRSNRSIHNPFQYVCSTILVHEPKHCQSRRLNHLLRIMICVALRTRTTDLYFYNRF